MYRNTDSIPGSPERYPLRTLVSAVFKTIMAFIVIVIPLADDAWSAWVQLSPSDDSYVDNADAAGNHGWRDYMIVGEWDGSSPYRTCRMYLKFNLSPIPFGQTITQAELWLNCRTRYSPPVQVGAHYLPNDNWQEMNITWNNAPTGFNPTATQTVTISDGFNYWIVTADVDSAYHGDGVYSVVMRVPNEGASAKGGWFDTDEYTDPGTRPLLEVHYEPAPQFVRGDYQADGDIDMFDAIACLNWLGGIGSPSTCDDAADAQDDGDIDMFDAIHVFNWLGGIGPPPPAPCCTIPGSCGPDPTTDALGCSSYPPCP